MTGEPLDLVIDAQGTVRGLYGEAIDLAVLGPLEIRRGSHVEPTPEGCWTADMSPCSGPVLGPFRTRSEALVAERDWLLRHWLEPGG